MYSSVKKKFNIIGRDWFLLDNAAKIYPANSSKKWNAIFGISATLKEKVNPESLQAALNEVIWRFPTFQCTLKKGLFWFYLEKLPFLPTIAREDGVACRKMRIYSGNHLFRVLYAGKTITLEVFHSLTDGTGASVFLNTLLKRYFELEGHTINGSDNTLLLSECPKESELEDSFLRYADLKSFRSRAVYNAYALKGRTVTEQKNENTVFRMKEDALIVAANKYGASVTQLVIAVLMRAAYEEQKSIGGKKKIVAEIPINLRKRLPSETVRNFSYFTASRIDPRKDDCTLGGVVNMVKNDIEQSVLKEWLVSNINTNVRDERSLFVRLVPRPLKTFAMNLASYIHGDFSETFGISALGRMKAPQEFGDLITEYGFKLAPPKFNNYTCSAICYNGTYCLNFAKNVATAYFERRVYKEFEAIGVEVASDNAFAKTDDAFRGFTKYRTGRFHF